MTNSERAKLLRSAASAIEHGRVSTAMRKLQEAYIPPPAAKPPAKQDQDRSECQNCGKRWDDSELEEITHGFWERVSPGEICPSGECPECGALCHPVDDNALAPYQKVVRQLLDTVASTGGLIVYTNGTVAPAADHDWTDLGDVVQAARQLMPTPMTETGGGDA